MMQTINPLNLRDFITLLSWGGILLFFALSFAVMAGIVRDCWRHMRNEKKRTADPADSGDPVSVGRDGIPRRKSLSPWVK